MTESTNLSPIEQKMQQFGLPVDYRPRINLSYQDQSSNWHSAKGGERQAISSADALDEYIQEKQAQACNLTLWIDPDFARYKVQIKQLFSAIARAKGFDGEIITSRANNADGMPVDVLRVRYEPYTDEFTDFLLDF